MEISHTGVHGKQSGPLLKVLESHKRVGKRIFEVYKDMDELMQGNAFILLGEAQSVCEGTREDGPFLLNSIGGPEECLRWRRQEGGGCWLDGSRCHKGIKIGRRHLLQV